MINTFSPAAFGPRHHLTQAILGMANPRPQFPGAPLTLPGGAGAPVGGTQAPPAPSAAPGAAPGLQGGMPGGLPGGLPGLPGMQPGSQPKAGGTMPAPPPIRY